MQTDLRQTESGNNQSAPPKDSKTPLAAATAVIPLRLFLGISFVAASLDKLLDPGFLNPNASTYIGNQLQGFAGISPLGDFLTNVAVPNAVLFGAMVAFGELAIGLGTLVGLFSRMAAFFGMLLSLSLWVVATWEVRPFFLGSDLPYAMGWLVLLIAGAHPVLSLDGQIKKWWTQRKAVALAQEAGYNNATPYQSTPLIPALAEDKSGIARRNFLMVAGATVAAGAVTGIAWSNSLNSGTTVADVPTSAPTSAPGNATATTAPAAQATATAVNVVPGNAPNRATESAPTTAPTTSAPATTAPTTSTPATTAPTVIATNAPAVKGTVLAALAAIPVGEAQKFTTPDTKEKAILIRQDDGSVKAFSTTCTHQGCEVNYIKASKALVCPCHGATYDGKTGAVTRAPATRPLTSFNIQVDGSGNIVYVQK